MRCLLIATRIRIAAAIVLLNLPMSAGAALLLRDSFDIGYPPGHNHATDLDLGVDNAARQSGLLSAAATGRTHYWTSNSTNTRLRATGPYANGVQLDPSAAEPCVHLASQLDLSRQRVVRVSTRAWISNRTPGSWVGLAIGRYRGGFVASPDHIGLYVTNQNSWVFCYDGQCEQVRAPGAFQGADHRLTLEVQKLGSGYVASAWVDDVLAVNGRPLTAGLSDRNVTAHACGAGDTASLDDVVVQGIPDRAGIGALRWDAWFESRVTTPELYNFAYWLRTMDTGYWARIPFWAGIVNEHDFYFDNTSQSSIDAEIRYASTALDYWTFLYYSEHDPLHDNLNYGWRGYMASTVRDDIGYAMMIGNTVFCDGCSHPGGGVASAPWPVTLPEIVATMRKSSYHRVLGHRPLLYVLEDARTPGESHATAQRLLQLRGAVRDAGLGDPYIVALAWGDYATWMAKGYDAVGSYSAHGNNYNETSGFNPLYSHSYLGLSQQSHHRWSGLLANAGNKAIPTGNSGWDCRPRAPIANSIYHCEGAYDPASAGDIAGQMLTMLQWRQLKAADTPADTALIYAWNEFDEGGWLSPTMIEGSARVDALTQALSGRIWLRDSFNLDAFETRGGQAGINETLDLNAERGAVYNATAPTRQIGLRGGASTASWGSNLTHDPRVQLRRYGHAGLTGALAIYPNSSQSCINVHLRENLQSLPDMTVSLELSASKIAQASWIGIVLGPTPGAFVDAPGHAAFYLQNNGASYYWRDGVVRSLQPAGTYPSDLHRLALHSQRSASAHTIRIRADGKLAAFDDAAAAVTPSYLTVWACGAGEAFAADSVSIQTPW